MIQNNLEIKTAGINDLKIIHQLALQIWEPTYRNIISKEQIDFMFQNMYSPDALLEQVSVKDHQFIIAFQQNQPIGFASYFFDDDCIRIPKLYVLPSNQRTGCGRILLNNIETIAKENNIKSIRLNVNRNNPALQFYLKVGFQIIEKIDIPYFGFVLNDYIMELR